MQSNGAGSNALTDGNDIARISTKGFDVVAHP